MLFLTSTEKLQVVTTTTAACHCYASWADIDAAGAVTYNNSHLVISSAATTDFVAAPVSGSTRNVRTLVVHAQGGANALTVQHYDGSTAYELSDANLAVDEEITYDEGQGFRVLDATGAIKTGSPTTGRLIKTTAYITGSGNHTTDPRTTTINVRLIGGGGGGGGCTTTTSAAACGAGGGGGGYAEKLFAVTANTAYAYACGALGSAGANTGGTGGTGGDSTFIVGGVTVTAKGGTGGVGMTAATTANTMSAPGACGGISTNGDVNGMGSPGGYGWRISGTVGVSGQGGSSTYGGGGKALVAAGAGSAGVGPGAAGGGGLVLNASAAVIGGAGIAGCVIVDEYS